LGPGNAESLWPAGSAGVTHPRGGTRHRARRLSRCWKKKKKKQRNRKEKREEGVNEGWPRMNRVVKRFYTKKKKGEGDAGVAGKKTILIS
jgi:hypothetical protein